MKTQLLDLQRKIFTYEPQDEDTNNEDVKGWFDGHPEIGKMQKNGN